MRRAWSTTCAATTRRSGTCPAIQYIEPTNNLGFIVRRSVCMWACSYAVMLLYSALIKQSTQSYYCNGALKQKRHACTQGITLDVTLRCRPATLIRSRTRCGRDPTHMLHSRLQGLGSAAHALRVRCVLHATALLLGCSASGSCSLIQCRRVRAGPYALQRSHDLYPDVGRAGRCLRMMASVWRSAS